METYSNQGWNCSGQSQASSDASVSVASDTNNDTSVHVNEAVLSACSKPFKFYRKQPTGSPFDMSFVKFGLPKRR